MTNDQRYLEGIRLMKSKSEEDVQLGLNIIKLTRLTLKRVGMWCIYYYTMPAPSGNQLWSNVVKYHKRVEIYLKEQGNKL